MSSNFPNAPDSITNNVDNTTPEFDIHPPLHNQLADSIMAVQVSLLPGGSLSLGDHVAAADPHPVYLTQAEADARYPLLSATDPYPVYLTQTEGDARYAPVSGGGYLTQVQADARYLQLAGGTLTGNLLFSTDNLRDIGAAGATRPRTLYLGTSLVTPGWTNGTNLLANTDNTYDIGASGANRPRNGYFAGTTQIGLGFSGLLAGDLSVARDATHGAIFFGANTNYLYFNAGTYSFNGGGLTVNGQLIGTGNFIAASTFWVNPGGASNLVEQRNGTNPQTLRLYNTYTDASNYERLTLTSAGSGLQRLFAEWAGTGAVGGLQLGASALYFASGTNGTLSSAISRWQIITAGHFTAFADNTYDIGGSAANRPRNGFFAGAVATGGKAGAAVDTDVTTPTDGMLRFDSTNNRLYIRIGAVWRYAALT
jgi:hypothetical protein